MTVGELVKSFLKHYLFKKSVKGPAPGPRPDYEKVESVQDKADNRVVVKRARTWFFDTRTNTF